MAEHFGGISVGDGGGNSLRNEEHTKQSPTKYSLEGVEPMILVNAGGGQVLQYARRSTYYCNVKRGVVLVPAQDLRQTCIQPLSGRASPRIPFSCIY